jgi:hypothetical protein
MAVDLPSGAQNPSPLGPAPSAWTESVPLLNVNYGGGSGGAAPIGLALLGSPTNQTFTNSYPKPRQNRAMSDGPTREEIDAKLGKISAETDTKVARMEGKLDLVLSKMDDVRDGLRSTRANQWVIGTALAVLIVALAFGVPAIFGNGLQLRDVVHTEVQEMLPKATPSPPQPQHP